MKYIILAVVFSSLISSAFAAENPKHKQFFLVNGSQASAEEAILASLRGAEAFKCSSVEAKVSKAGTSIGLRSIKKNLK